MFADDIVRALLVVHRQVALGEVVAGRTLVAGNFSALENREREARGPTHMDLVGSQTSGGAERVAVREFNVRELFIPVGLELADDHLQHLGHRCRLGGRSWWQFSEPREAGRRRAKALSKTGGCCSRICCAGIPRGECNGCWEG